MVLSAAVADGVDFLVHVVAPRQGAQAAQHADVPASQAAERKYAQAAGREYRHEGAVLEFADHVGIDALFGKPAVQRLAQHGMAGGQEYRQAFQAVREILRVRLAHQLGGAVPVHGRRHQAVAGQAQVGVGRRALAGQHQVQMMLGKFAQQFLDLAFVAGQAQVRRVQHRAQQGLRGQLGNAVRQAYRQAYDGLGGGGADLLGQHLADLEDLFGAGERGFARVGQRHAATGRLEQLVAQVLFQFAHLRADGLDCHVQPFGSTGKSAFLGDHPEVVQVSIIEHGRNHFGFFEP